MSRTRERRVVARLKQSPNSYYPSLTRPAHFVFSPSPNPPLSPSCSLKGLLNCNEARRILMHKPVLFGALALLSLSGLARADVTWEHTANVSAGGVPLVSFNLRNDWSGQNHRARLAFDATNVAGGFGGTGGAPAKGTLDVIERLGDDRLVFALRNPQNTGVAQYVSEPYSTLQNRLRLNFFEALDPQFAANTEPVPSLTDEQRRRLGRELRAYTKPFRQAYSRQFFRALPQMRTINGLECRGYRYTSMTKLPKSVGDGAQAWIRMASEFWIASNQTDDDEIASFTTQANALKSGAPTVSMWLNEAFPVLAEAMPDEAQNAVAALIGRRGEANYGFRGTPVQFAVTISAPPASQMGVSDLRFQAQLTRRSNDAIPERAFAVPTSGTRVQIEPFLQIMRNGIQQGRKMIQQGLGDML